jgi:hypothetical protein
MKRLVIFYPILAFLLAGCASNNVARFYKGSISQEDAAAYLRPFGGRTNVVEASDLQAQADSLERQGYVLVGESWFYGPSCPTEREIEKYGQKCGADVVLYFCNYEGSSQSTLALPQFNAGTTATTYASGTVYGPTGQSARFSGIGTTTTPGSASTTYVPITVNRYRSGVTFWRKALPPVLGLRVEDLPDSLRVSLKRNAGVIIKIVLDDSPAFYANILPGDVLVSIDNQPITSMRDFSSVIRPYEGKRVALTVIRDGQETVIPLQLNAR